MGTVIENLEKIIVHLKNRPNWESLDIPLDKLRKDVRELDYASNLNLKYPLDGRYHYQPEKMIMDIEDAISNPQKYAPWFPSSTPQIQQAYLGMAKRFLDAYGKIADLQKQQDNMREPWVAEYHKLFEAQSQIIRDIYGALENDADMGFGYGSTLAFFEGILRIMKGDTHAPS